MMNLVYMAAVFSKNLEAEGEAVYMVSVAFAIGGPRPVEIGSPPALGSQSLILDSSVLFFSFFAFLPSIVLCFIVLINRLARHEQATIFRMRTGCFSLQAHMMLTGNMDLAL